MSPDLVRVSKFLSLVLRHKPEEIGLTPEFTDTSFDTIFRDTANGQFDLAAAASTITPAREKVVTFSDPYYESQQALVVVEGSDIASVEDLSGTIVAAQDASAELFDTIEPEQRQGLDHTLRRLMAGLPGTFVS